MGGRRSNSPCLKSALASWATATWAVGVELAIRQNADMRLVALFTRRDPSSLTPLTEGVPVYSADSLPEHTADIDVLVLCGGSATDLPEQTPRYASLYNVVDSFDTHANIPQHFANVDAAAKEGGKVAVISGGWDPGMFSIARLYANCILPEGQDYTFWGRGVFPGPFRRHSPHSGRCGRSPVHRSGSRRSRGSACGRKP